MKDSFFLILGGISCALSIAYGIMVFLKFLKLRNERVYLIKKFTNEDYLKQEIKKYEELMEKIDSIDVNSVDDKTIELIKMKYNILNQMASEIKGGSNTEATSSYLESVSEDEKINYLNNIFRKIEHANPIRSRQLAR